MSPTQRSNEIDESALQQLLEAIDASLEAEQPERALELCEVELKRAPDSPKLLALRGECLDRMGDREEAVGAYKKALKVAPKDLFVLRSAVEFLMGDPDENPDSLENAVTLAQRGVELARSEKETEAQIDFLLAQGIAYNTLGNSTAALGPLDKARALSPDAPDADVAFERGFALFQLCRFSEARTALERVLVLDTEHAPAHQYLGYIAERDGDDRTAERHFERARKLAPDDFLPPVVLSPEAFERAIEEALEGLPKKLQRYLENVAISVEEIPAEADLTRSTPPASPEILGLYQGTPLTEQSILAPADPWGSFPSSIALYQRNLQRFAATRDELIDEIGITLIHEIGHFLGLSEEELYERGLD